MRGGQPVGRILQKTKQAQPGLLIGVGQRGAKGRVFPVEHSLDRIAVIACEYHWQVKNRHVRDKRDDRRGLADDELDIVVLHLAQQIGIAAQFAVGVVGHGQLTAGNFVQPGCDTFTKQLAGSAFAGRIRTDQYDRFQRGILRDAIFRCLRFLLWAVLSGWRRWAIAGGQAAEEQ